MLPPYNILHGKILPSQPPSLSTLQAGGSLGALQGVILRSQLLVLLQSRAFCDRNGAPLGPGAPQDHEAVMAWQFELDRRMRRFYRQSFTHK